MQAAGLNPAPAEVLNAHRQLDPRDTGNVAFSDLENWLSQQILVQKRSNLNRLLVKPVVGKGKRPTYDVPGAAHTYGQPVVRDEVHGKDLLFNWTVAQRSKSTEAYVDRVKMNRAAVQKGCVTAKDFVNHSQTDRIYTYMKKKTKPKTVIDATQAFGQKPFHARRSNQPSMADLITAKYNDAMFDEETEYPTVTSKDIVKTKVDPGVSGGAPFSTALPSVTKQPGTKFRHTKASKLAAQQRKKQLQPEQKKVFTLKQFRNVAPRVSTRRVTGHNVVQDAGY